MAGWQGFLTRLVHHLEERYDRLIYPLHYRLGGGPEPIKIVAYRGYGDKHRLYLKGRVLEDKGETPASVQDTFWKDLLNMYRRLESDEVPGARLQIRYQGREFEVVADEEGYFEAQIETPHPQPPGELWARPQVRLLSPLSHKQSQPVETQGEIYVPPATVRFGVISDIDDTVVRSETTHLLRMARNVFLGNARTRLPFPGVPAFYQALFQGPAGGALNPLFYVSSSPWNLYDLLAQFFQLHQIPVGPVLFLRDWGVTDNELLPVAHRQHKVGIIRQLLDFYRELPFILIGDSGQEDPEIYAEMAQQYPGRILAIYIREVSRVQKRLDALRALAQKLAGLGSPLVVAEDTLALAEHAAAQGWITPEALGRVRAGQAQVETLPQALPGQP